MKRSMKITRRMTPKELKAWAKRTEFIRNALRSGLITEAEAKRLHEKGDQGE